MGEVTIAITPTHNEFDAIIHTLDKALRGASVKVVEDLLAPIVKGLQKGIERFDASSPHFFHPGSKSEGGLFTSVVSFKDEAAPKYPGYASPSVYNSPNF